ncbi:hypothetical protein [Streptomyces sp. TLI_171]|uniref:hypothetical protein n=1 Tax=Streptomyces sp. TLI_171 TaxID=1938859 RepID=UPI000C47F578|nr:hypothetical protein [Streptomyces sp. TLI_171]RKE19222.1 hypothetical protein BX266_2537 [Streptomyces sp. TLI_171]
MGELTEMTVRARQLGLRVAALAVAGLLLTACNDDDPAGGAATQAGAAPSASSSAAASPSGSATGKAKAPANGGKATGRPTTAAAVPNAAAAQAKLGKIALTDAEWDRGFVSDGDDGGDLTRYTMDASCKLKADGTVPGLTATVVRYVRQDHEADATFANTAANQFATADAAHKDIAQVAADDKRCENYTDGGTSYKAVHAIESPKVAGADEVYAEEGLAVYDTTDGGRTADRPFSYVVARKGAVTVSVWVDVDPDRQVFEGRAQAQEALKKLVAKW